VLKRESRTASIQGVGREADPAVDAGVRRSGDTSADRHRDRADGPAGSTFLDRALQRHVRFPTLYRAYCRHLGRPGWARARELICASADRADSAAERLLIKILRDGGVIGWVLGYPFGPWTIDLAFPEQKVAIEVDGWAWHVDAERFRNDRRKQNALVRAGRDPLRFTWHDLDGHPATVLAEVTATLAPAA
jgi:very-short-patch-repair endonuclease